MITSQDFFHRLKKVSFHSSSERVTPWACMGKFTVADNRSLTRGSTILSHPLSNKMIYQWNNTPQLCLSFTADSTQSLTVVTLMQLFHSPALLARNSVLVVSGDRAIFRYDLEKWFL